MLGGVRARNRKGLFDRELSATDGLWPAGGLAGADPAIGKLYGPFPASRARCLNNFVLDSLVLHSSKTGRGDRGRSSTRAPLHRRVNSVGTLQQSCKSLFEQGDSVRKIVPARP